jgi:hypothetical protein
MSESGPKIGAEKRRSEVVAAGTGFSDVGPAFAGAVTNDGGGAHEERVAESLGPAALDDRQLDAISQEIVRRFNERGIVFGGARPYELVRTDLSLGDGSNAPAFVITRRGMNGSDSQDLVTLYYHDGAYQIYKDGDTLSNASTNQAEAIRIMLNYFTDLQNTKTGVDQTLYVPSGEGALVAPTSETLSSPHAPDAQKPHETLKSMQSLARDLSRMVRSAPLLTNHNILPHSG